MILFYICDSDVITLKNSILYFLILQLLLIVACNSLKEPKRIQVKLNGTSPKEIYETAKTLNSTQADSLYETVFNALIDSNKFVALEEHRSQYHRIKSNSLKSNTLEMRIHGWVVNSNGAYDSSIVFFSKTAYNYKLLKDTSGIIDSYFGIGVNKMYLGQYDAMFANLLKALNYAEQSHDSVAYFKVNTALANGYLTTNEYKKSFSTLQLSINYFKRKKKQDAIAYCQSLKSRIYYKQGDFVKSIDYSNMALEYRRKIKDTSAISASLNNIAASYMGLGEWAKALHYFEESDSLLIALKRQIEVPIVQYNIAKCQWKMGNISVAESALLKLIEDAKKNGELPIMVASYKLLSDINSDKKQYDLAYEYLEKNKQCSDQLFNDEKEKITKELLTKYETSRKEAKIKQLNTEKREDQIKMGLYLSLLAATLLVAMIFIIVLRNRSKTSQMKFEQVQIELKNNSEALNQFTEHIVRKNIQIEQLEHSLHLNRENKLNSINDEQVSELYQLKILTEEDWQNFKILFDKVYPGFLNNLRKAFPEITPSEERQSLLIKLNLNNKECASMLGISLDGIKKSRYRLRKRFLLDEEKELDMFVKTI